MRLPGEVCAGKLRVSIVLPFRGDERRIFSWIAFVTAEVRIVAGAIDLDAQQRTRALLGEEAVRRLQYPALPSRLSLRNLRWFR